MLAGCGTDPPPNTNGTNQTTGEGECTPGERECTDPKTLATCAVSTTGVPRLVTTACLDAEVCQQGDCVPRTVECSDTCVPPATRCTSSGEVETCADHDGDGCVEFGSAVACDAGQQCDPSDGLCKAASCTDSCTEGETSCEGELISTCATSPAGCLAFSPGKECPDEGVCEAGACSEPTTCTDECTLGEFACTGDGQVRECRTDVDDDTCTEFAAPQACAAGQTCRMGQCVPDNACQDQCLAGEGVCLGNDIATCAMQDDGCLAFPQTPTACAAGQTCQSAGGTVACVAIPVTGTVVINEIFYDALGNDRRPEGTPTFIELFGPAGLDISGYTIDLVNGANGESYHDAVLPAGSQLDGRGFAVLVHEDADTFLSFALPFATNVYDVLGTTGGASNQDILQNGPDNVRLLNASGTVIDAVGYGNFGTETFVGEGAPVAATVAGRSIGRDKTGKDTDNNAADFLSYPPTPGFPNTDLIINEIYVDQPGTDDGSETFVEIVHPTILGWEDLSLNGYTLHAINGLNGEDYIFTGALPGIEFDGTMLNEGDTEGYVVVCNIDTASNALLSKCTVPFEGVDFQNGPDNFVLRYDGRVVDAIGYGTFSATDVFVGEGTPRALSSSNAGKALGRWRWSDFSRQLDTDDNSVDFHLVDPTPGGENPLP